MEHPKVRFSQPVEKVVEQKKIEKTKGTSSKAKIKIKSIVPINYPIKILEDGKLIFIQNLENKNKTSELSGKNIIEKKHNTICTIKKIDFNKSTPNFSSILIPKSFKPLREVDTRKSSNILKSEISSNEYYPKNEKFQIQNDKRTKDFFKVKMCRDKLDINNSPIKTSNSKHIENRNNKNDNLMFTKNICTDNCEKKVPCITCDDSDDDSDIEIVQSINTSRQPMLVQNVEKNRTIHDINCIQSKINFKSILEKRNNIYNNWNKDRITQKDKENYSKILKSEKGKNEFITFSTTKSLNDVTNTTCHSTEKFITQPSKFKKKISVIPFAKFKTDSSTNNKNIEKLIKTQVKKSNIFHVYGNNDVTVQPAIFSKKKINENSNAIGINKKTTILSKDLLSRPEYNSTICVIKKLQEIEKEKLINDFEHLPTNKNFLYNKVSNALDFAPYESVYKDLINLSVDNQKLPLKLMRSKDPEPRDKDIIPKLFDFYNPKYTEQYYVIVNPITSNPVDINTLNAFTVSNKIYIWKISRDNF